MNRSEQWLRHYEIGVEFPTVSGFELLEVLDIRSKLAASESELSETQRKQLEAADAVFLRNASAIHASISEIADLGVMRERASAPCSHWWWYLDKLVAREAVAA